MTANPRNSENGIKAIIKESQVFLTVAYVVSIGIGMLFTYEKYSEFGINIFEYADVFDFLIAPFSDFKILVFTIISLIFTFLVLRMDLAYQKYFPKSYSKMTFGLDRKKWYNMIRYPSFALLFLFYLHISARSYGEMVKDEILSQTPVQVVFSDDQFQKGKVVGKTKEVLFLTDGNSVKAIPITSFVKTIEIRR